MKKAVVTITILLVVLMGACEGPLEEDVGEGTIVITLTRDIIDNTEKVNYSGFTTEPMASASEENDWPRSVEDVQEVLEGYRVRIEGEGVDVFKNAFFKEGEDEVTIEISIPAGDDYSITILALGEDYRGNNDFLLGAGKAAGIIVKSAETTNVSISMEPYKYSFEETTEQVQVGEKIEVIYNLKGPLLSEIWGGWIYLYYSMDSPEEEKFGERISSGISSNREIISKNHWRFKFDVTGQNNEGLLYFQIYTYLSSEWRYEGRINPSLFTPSVNFNEEIPTVEIEEADSSIVIEPVW